MRDNPLAGAEALIIFLIGLGLVLVIAEVLILLYLIISALYLIVTYHIRREQAKERFEQVITETGAYFDADNVIAGIFGPDFQFTNSGSQTTVDHFERVILGSWEDDAA